MKVPFVDLYAQYLTIKEEIDHAIHSVIVNSSYIGGDIVKQFENAFSNYLGVKNIIGCANGTDSLELVLKAWGIGEGDEVIVPAHSWISTSEAVGNVGATPVFVDVEPDYYTINVALIEPVITNKTRAIIPVHLYGHPADMQKIMQIADKYSLKVLEDCAQAHGSSIDGKKVGTFGHAASFSFYPGKNLGAYGDAGCIATEDDDLAELLRMHANHGQRGKHNHLIEGRNSRLDGMQAAILLTKLKYLDQWTAERIFRAAKYTELISNIGLTVPKIKPGYRHVFHLYVIRVAKRKELMRYLNVMEIETAVHYPLALPFLPCYSKNSYKCSDFPVAFTNQDLILSIPIYPELTFSQQSKVVEAIQSFFNV